MSRVGICVHGVVIFNFVYYITTLQSGILGWQSDIAMSATSIPTNNVHNKSFTDVPTTMLWPSSKYTLCALVCVYSESACALK